MILIDNRNVLRKIDREILNKLTQLESRDTPESIQLVHSKTGVLTLKKEFYGKSQYIHSKYDPEKEAERFVTKFENETYKNVLFIGLGLGYHVKKFMEIHPNTNFSIYEPDEEIFYGYLSNTSLKDLPLNKLKRIITGSNPTEITNKLDTILQEANGVIKIIILPVYEKYYGDQIELIMKNVVDSMKDRKSSILTNFSYQKRWTINSIKNFPVVLNTPNILLDIDKKLFEGKPAIIVAAGPSLNEEFENLRYIKEHNLAYIFSVGSAINALIEKGIYPDAACTYDPQDINYKVINIIKEKNIKEIPLIFGSSVGFETLIDYPGKMLHMIVSQDTVSPLLLKHNYTDVLETVNDAPSISVVIYQVLVKLGFTDIILVGQNLAYVNKKHYANGIDYGNNSNNVNDEILVSAPLIEDVYGNDVKTSEVFIRMKQQLEMYIKLSPQVKVTNTTVRGALIEGTVFKPLKLIIEENFKNKVVQKDWFNRESNYKVEYLAKQLSLMEKEKEVLWKLLMNGISYVSKIEQKVNNKDLYRIENEYIKLDKVIEKIKENGFYSSYIAPMIRVQYEGLVEKIQSVRFEKNKIITKK